MIDKTKFRCAAKKQGDVVVIHVYGDGSCLWLNMYLDKGWQMVCDSDIGTYAYNWNRCNGVDAFVAFCCDWLADEDWLLRKCVDDQCLEKAFDSEESAKNLRAEIKCATPDCGIEEIDYLFNEAETYNDKEKTWLTAIDIKAGWYDIDLPEEWWECAVETYTPRQKRFAEICREVIVPELKKLIGVDGGNSNENA